MSNEIAPDGSLYVCLACGKMSKDRYGDMKISRGWDESCFLNCDLFEENRLVIENGLVIKVLDKEETNAFH